MLKTRVCYICGRSKGEHLFTGGKWDCKLCTKRAKAAKKDNMTAEEFIKYKATQLRNNWRARAKKLGRADEVPSSKEIREWLTNELYTHGGFKCGFTYDLVGRDFGVDHLDPIARGGSFKLDNLCIIDPKLNGIKGDMNKVEFHELLDMVLCWEDGGTSLMKRLQSSNNMFNKRRK